MKATVLILTGIAMIFAGLYIYQVGKYNRLKNHYVKWDAKTRHHFAYVDAECERIYQELEQLK